MQLQVAEDKIAEVLRQNNSAKGAEMSLKQKQMFAKQMAKLHQRI